jgi:hypothetical protein
MRGRLVAVDGTSGARVQTAAYRVLEALRAEAVDAGCSRWDSSGIFYELHGGSLAPTITPRALLLLYAADLAFRLRWEIEPALSEGKTVIAAPYVETAIALGKAARLSRRWMLELFRFAPTADSTYRSDEAGPLDGGPLEGPFEFSTVVQDAAFADGIELRRRALVYLDGRERAKKCRTLPSHSSESPRRPGEHS